MSFNHIRCVKAHVLNVLLVFTWVQEKAFCTAQVSQGEQLLNEQFQLAKAAL